MTIAAVAMAAPLLAQKNILPAPIPQPTPAPEAMGIDEATARMTVPVEVGGHGPFPFIIDTGAERSVVSRELAQSLGLDAGARARVFDFAGPSMVNTVRVPFLKAGSLSTALLEAPVLAAINLGAPGILGIDALQGRKLVIDFDHRQMTVTPAKKRARGEVIVKAEVKAGQLIVTNASFAGHPISVILDTGTSVSIGNSAMRALARRRPKALGPITVWAVTGRSFNTDYVTVDDLRIGEVRFNKVGMSFADVAPFERFGLSDRPALILGMSTLKMFRRVEIDFANRDIGFLLADPHGAHDGVCSSEIPPCWGF